MSRTICLSSVNAMVLLLSASAVSAQAPRDSAVRLETKTGVLHGTLMLPAASGASTPVALIISGSGPTDRDGNSPMLPGKNNSLKLVAEALASQGIASLRYDKRGIAQSIAAGMTEDALRFDTYVTDAVAWMEELRGTGRFSKHVFVGHSEGALIGAMAAHRTAADGLVSIAGAGRPARAVIEEQVAKNAPQFTEDVTRILRELSAGRTVPNTPPALGALFRPSVQPYLISWINIDPAEEIARLNVPVLVVQGTTDVQVDEEDAKLLTAKNARATLALVEGMNHVLKEVREPAKQLASYSDPELALHPRLVTELAGFTRQWITAAGGMK